MNTIVTDKHIFVLGLGLTGWACVRFLLKRGKRVTVMDTREAPPYLSELRSVYPQVPVLLGAFDEAQLVLADEIIVSPGVPLSDPAIGAAIQMGVPVRGDIDLFTDYARAPVVGITGSNGKTTVTSLLGEMAKQAGLNVAVGGNIGVPALDLLSQDVELYVLELSSFQLETTAQLSADSVVLLNLSEDHMDRYADKMAYLNAKRRIFRGCKTAVVNDDEVLSQPLLAVDMKVVHFGLNAPDVKKYSTMEDQDGSWICFGFDRLLKIDQLAIQGQHNLSNALAALALGRSVGLPTDAMLSALQAFQGLPHRCQWVREVNGVQFINDSKGTNVGATQAAIESLGAGLAGKIVLIAGGDGKGADFQALGPAMARFGRAAVLIGKDAKRIAQYVVNVVSVCFAESLQAAVQQAQGIAQKGDMVLLSPACASLDMFLNYEQRGEQFIKEVNAL